MRKDFFILSFFVVYILFFGLVRLRSIRLSNQVEAHIERWCSRSCGEDVTITDVIIKILDKKWTGDVNDVMPGSDGLWIWGDFWKNAVSWDLKLDEASWFLDLGEGSLQDAPRVVGSYGAVSILKIVSLSSCWKPKSQEGNKSFVPEPRESSVFRDSYACERSTYQNVFQIRTFHIFILLNRLCLTAWKPLLIIKCQIIFINSITYTYTHTYIYIYIQTEKTITPWICISIYLLFNILLYSLHNG